MEYARTVKRDFFPLDEELGLLPGTLTPSLQQDLVRLGTWMPFARAVSELAHFRCTDVSKSTVRRLTEAAGAAYVCVQDAEVTHLERKTPMPPPGPAQQFLSVDGAMVPLVGGEWAEVKTLVIGEVLPSKRVKGEAVIQTSHHSYFSRMTDATSFARLALVETQRRGVETAQAVAAVTDGAEWIQKFIDYHRQDAVRILDFPHAGEYLNKIAQGLWGEQEAQKQSWLHEQLARLKQQGGTMLATLRQELGQQALHPDLTSAWAYLEKRLAHMHYPLFQQQGWPIGDGAVESANKLVVEVRLKGSGMHWARAQVDPMLALRNIACNDRWPEAWPQITATLRLQARQQSSHRRHQRRLATPLPMPSTSITPVVVSAQPLPSPFCPSSPPSSPAKPSSQQPWRPAADHPWRHTTFGRSRFNPPSLLPNAKS